MSKTILIPYDYVTSDILSFGEAIEAIKENKSFCTNCLEFFDFSMLDKNYDVKVVKENGDYIILSQLLDNTKEYTIKEIRKAHNVRKMLLADCFDFKKA